MNRVVFISSRPMPRCENITAVYNAFEGNKIFDRMWDRTSDILHNQNSEYSLVVTDELVRESKAPVIMIYHGAAAGKTYLLQRINDPDYEVIKKSSKLLKYAITTSTNGIFSTASQCGLPEKNVLPYGMPRMDVYFGKKKGDGHTFLSEYDRAYLYAPTFRSLWETTIPDIDLKVIDDILTDHEIFAVKPHMVTKNFTMDEYRHVKLIPNTEPSAPYLIDCDVLVTDYSSIMFDAHVMKKPVVLFEKDSESYLQEPGMCMDYPYGYASRHCRDENSLVDILRKADKPGEEDEKCRIMTSKFCDGHSTERVIELINDILEGRR